MNAKANKIMKQLCIDHDITYCEVCGGEVCANYFLTYCHKQKRRYYNTIDELTDFREWILAGLKCHESLEYNRKELQELFSKLRP